MTVGDWDSEEWLEFGMQAGTERIQPLPRLCENELEKQSNSSVEHGVSLGRPRTEVLR